MLLWMRRFLFALNGASSNFCVGSSERREKLTSSVGGDLEQPRYNPPPKHQLHQSWKDWSKIMYRKKLCILLRRGEFYKQKSDNSTFTNPEIRRNPEWRESDIEEGLWPRFFYILYKKFHLFLFWIQWGGGITGHLLFTPVMSHESEVYRFYIF